ncbi:poly [ADP-ribose] polymerase 1, partial [Tanacetum coccineum]
DFALELEEVFTVDRQGEFDKFSPYKDKLKNKMLLWHGSRLTNFVGILSQGLRIAPHEAPASGDMFGKGIYFADLVSKSAKFCKSDKKNPVGLMLLSEVALGDIYELKKEEYMDKPPKGKDSTKGLGEKIPDESEHVKWRDDVVVPCGKPVSSNVKATELMYNEYIVYNPDQVKLQFLLKIKNTVKTFSTQYSMDRFNMEQLKWMVSQEQELTDKEKIHEECDIRTTNIVLQGLPPDV